MAPGGSRPGVFLQARQHRRQPIRRVSRTTLPSFGKGIKASALCFDTALQSPYTPDNFPEKLWHSIRSAGCFLPLH